MYIKMCVERSQNGRDSQTYFRSLQTLHALARVVIGG
jgi:hypothetical protein